ncbi:MAG TPA: DUF169 domain-containing protein [Polyangia bacterium]|nr:DUF169 domain-containing protein [Polyangia bacterium]
MDARATRVKEILGLRRPPIMIGFLDALPARLARWSGGPVAAGCVFWDRAMDGKSFYTLPADHWNCAVGSHTHHIGLPPDRANELAGTIGFMVETRYLDAAEVPGIPTLDKEPAAVAYAPAGGDAFKADVVLLAVTPAQSTLVFEAALKAGIARGGAAGATSRPSCAILPASAKTEMVALSFGCRGNRTYSTLGDDEMYVAIPGPRWDDFVDRLSEVQRSNLTMGNYYQAQAAKFSAAK